MSLIRQVWFLLLLTLVIAFVGAVGVSVHAARHYLEAQLSLKNNDAAQVMALMLSQQRGDPTAMELGVASQFDTGGYQRIELVSPSGSALVARRATARSGQVPQWFADWLAIEPAVGVAQVSDGWKQIGRLEVLSQADYAYGELWHSSLETIALLGCVAVVAGLLASIGVTRIRRPLEAVVDQARALTERRFITVSEPAIPELRNVTRAMNAMVARLKSMFDEQAGQVDQLRRQANCDALTGISNRAHFMGRLKGLLNSEDGSAGGAIVLVRLTDLQGLNRQLGRQATDTLLQESAAAITEAATRAGSSEVGRLNGSDFAMILPDVGSLREPAVDVAARLRHLLRARGCESSAVVGAVRWWHGAPMSSLLAAADQALARAEARGPYSVELDDTGDGLVLGEAMWRQRIEAALDKQLVCLVEYPLVDVRGNVVHFECPLRLKVEDGGDWMSAALWLPMARRSQLTARIDLAAVQLALIAIAKDGLARSVNVCPGSLLDSAFVPGLRAALAAQPNDAPGLWLEVAEVGALRQLHLLREMVTQSHAFGARVGLEHAGDCVSSAASLLEAGLDFVKLDASLTEGMAADSARAQHVASSARMLRGVGLSVYAEGVINVADAEALWHCGVDGVTGPVVASLSRPTA